MLVVDKKQSPVVPQSIYLSLSKKCNLNPRVIDVFVLNKGDSKVVVKALSANPNEIINILKPIYEYCATNNVKSCFAKNSLYIETKDFVKLFV